MDGIKPTGQPSSDDQTLSSTSVMVDLLHPNEATNVPTQAPVDTTTLPEPRPAAPKPVPAPLSVSPITPPLHAPLEPTFEMVTSLSSAATTLPVTPTVSTPPVQPVPAQAAPVVADVVQPQPVAQMAPAFTMPPEDPPAAAAASKSALQPKRGGRILIIIVIALIILAAIGAALYFFVLKPKAAPAPAVAKIPVTATAPTNLQQTASGSPLAPGATATVVPTFQMTVPTSATSGTITPEFEAEPIGTAFTGAATTSGAAVTATGKNLILSVTPSQLANGAYHWQVRTKVGSTTSSWTVFDTAGTNTTGDFVLNATPQAAATPVVPTAPTVTGVTNGTITGTTVALTQNQATFTGKTDAGTTVSLVVSPDAITLTPTVAADGTWSVAVTQNLGNGAHTLDVSATNSSGGVAKSSYTLNINVATALTTPNAPATSSPTAATPATTATPAADTSLAATGDPTTTLSLVGLIVATLAASGLFLLRRQRTE